MYVFTYTRKYRWPRVKTQWSFECESTPKTYSFGHVLWIAPKRRFGLRAVPPFFAPVRVIWPPRIAPFPMLNVEVLYSNVLRGSAHPVEHSVLSFVRPLVVPSFGPCFLWFCCHFLFLRPPSFRPPVVPSLCHCILPSCRPAIFPSFHQCARPFFRPSVHPPFRPSVLPCFRRFKMTV